jgi:hypothetical protein
MMFSILSLALTVTVLTASSLSIASENTSMSQLSTIENVKVKNGIKVYGGFQESRFRTDEFTAGTDNYLVDFFRVSHFQLGMSIPSGERVSLKPYLLLGTIQTDQSIVPQMGVSQRSAVNGSSLGGGIDSEYAIWGTTFDLKLGASYRFMINRGGFLDNIKRSQGGGGSMQQSLHTTAFYLSPTFTNKHITMSMNLGIGYILDEYVSGMSINTDRMAILSSPFAQMGASAAYNF